MKQKCRFFFIFFLLLSLENCATVNPIHTNHTPLARPQYLVENYTSHQIWTETKKEHQPDGSWYIELSTEQNPHQQSPILMEYFPSGVTGHRPALIISPILGGKNRVANHFARHFAKYGYHGLVVHRPKDLMQGLDTPADLDNRLRNAVIRDRAALDWLVRQPNVAEEALGSFGISYGGIKNVLLAGVEDRLKVNVFALAGADLPSIITHSNLPNLIKMRNEMMERKKWDQDRLEAEIRNSFLSEPLRFVPYIDSDTTMLVLARMDHTVPRKNGELLRRALGNPKTLYLPAGHYSGAMLTGMILYPFIENRVLQFYDINLLPLLNDPHDSSS